MHPAGGGGGDVRGADDVLPGRDRGVRARQRDGEEAEGVDAARPAPDPDLRFLRGAAPLRDRVPPLHDLLREGPGLPGLLRQGLRAPPRRHGAVAGLLRAPARGPRPRLAPPARRRYRAQSLLDPLPRLLLAGEVRLTSPSSSLLPLRHRTPTGEESSGSSPILQR